MKKEKKAVKVRTTNDPRVQLDREIVQPRKKLAKLVSESAKARRSLIKIPYEISKCHAQQTESKPMPKKAMKAIEDHQMVIEKMRAGTLNRPPISTARESKPSWWGSTGAGSATSDCETEVQISSLSCDMARFDIVENSGTSGVVGASAFGFSEVDNIFCKTAHGYAGTASLSPDNGAIDYSHIMFGFWSGYRVPFPNETVNVKIKSSPRIFLHFPDGWLEALSFRPDAIGFVHILANINVISADFQQQQNHLVLTGMSPPATSNDWGIWHPEPEPVDKELLIEFNINNSNTLSCVYIYESVECIAIRYGDIQNCNAVAECTGGFPPIQVEATKICS